MWKKIVKSMMYHYFLPLSHGIPLPYPFFVFVRDLPSPFSLFFFSIFFNSSLSFPFFLLFSFFFSLYSQVRTNGMPRPVMARSALSLITRPTEPTMTGIGFCSKLRWISRTLTPYKTPNKVGL